MYILHVWQEGSSIETDGGNDRRLLTAEEAQKVVARHPTLNEKGTRRLFVDNNPLQNGGAK